MSAEKVRRSKDAGKTIQIPLALDTFPAGPALRQVLHQLESGQRVVRASGLSSPALALLLARLAAGIKRPILAVTPNLGDAERLSAAATAFTHQLERAGALPVPVYKLPPPSYWPYQFHKLQAEDRSARIQALSWLADSRSARAPSITITSSESVMSKLPEPAAFAARRFQLTTGADLRREVLIQQLIDAGYNRVPQVLTPGDVALRGAVVDIFTPDRGGGVRVEFMGNKIASLRLFNPETQKSISLVQTALVLPIREVVGGATARSRIVRAFETDPRFTKIPALRRRAWVEELDRGLSPERFASAERAFSEPLVTVDEWLPANTVIVAVNPEQIAPAIVQFLDQATKFDEQNAAEPFPTRSHLYLDPEDWELFTAGHQLFEHSFFTSDPDTVAIPCREVESCESRVADLAERLQRWGQESSVILAIFRSAATESKVRRALAELQTPAVAEDDEVLSGSAEASVSAAVPVADLHTAIGEIDEGFFLPEERLIVLSEREILGQARLRQRGARWSERDFGLTFADLRDGDYVVHIDHGIGRYSGLKRISEDGALRDMIVLEYAENTKLLIPVDRLNRLQRYVALGQDAPPLDRLGGTRWLRTRKKVKAELLRMASLLLKLYAHREVAAGFAFSPPSAMHNEFELGFPYEETPDQLKAWIEVEADMEAARPMDRLICGDVGFGKTEIALRAAFKAVFDGKQVAVLTPTTVLAAQHYATFSSRFARFPVQVHMLSRFVTGKEEKDVIAKVAAGQGDIVIGTHRLLSSDVTFKNLGLLIIDEEHRFGVAAKERLKKLRMHVDILSLTATPIPRTLNLGLAGIRDMSLIKTAPDNRLPIETHLAKFSSDLIYKAIVRELERGGQVFVVHNRIQSIGSISEFIQRLVPQARILVGHGQLAERELRKIMVEFSNRRADILVSTAIIESGLDIPTVNTIIINRADTFGMAQLYQLRGRVGRDRYQAYAYLLVPSLDGLTPDARKRLQAIAQARELGAGFRIASADLEIRGAGEILGIKQHGHIAAIGFEMYSQLLREAVHELRGQTARDLLEPEINVPFTTAIPEEFIPNTQEKLELYQRLSRCEQPKQVSALQEEIEDRYGRLPDGLVNLTQVIRLKVEAQRLNIERIDVHSGRAVLAFHHIPGVPPEAIIAWVNSNRGRLRFTGERGVTVDEEELTTANGLPVLVNILQELRE